MRLRRDGRQLGQALAREEEEEREFNPAKERLDAKQTASGYYDVTTRYLHVTGHRLTVYKHVRARVCVGLVMHEK